MPELTIKPYQKFGRLTVICKGATYYSGQEKHPRFKWICKCDCGNTTNVCTRDLKSGKVASCGCYRREHTRKFARTHGLSHTRLYEIRTKMIARCYNPKTTYYYNYGGRGITVCDEWLESFENFKAWADKSGYADNLTIERIDNDGNYCPENCTWITQVEQNRNRRTSHFVTYKGQKMLLAELSRLTHVAPQTIKKYEKSYNFDYDRIIQDVLNTPNHKYGLAKKGRK